MNRRNVTIAAAVAVYMMVGGPPAPEVPAGLGVVSALPLAQGDAPIFALLTLTPALAWAGEGQVQVHAGLVSAAFEATPAQEAFDAIRRATGLEIIVLPRVSPRTLTLIVEPAPFEVVLRRVVEALDLGGYAIAYAPDGAAERLIVVGKGQRTEGRAPRAAETPSRQTPEAGSPTRPGGPTVPVLIPKAEAESMKLGAPGQVILVESAPVGKTQTSECDGVSGDYPVQSVLVMAGSMTYVTSIVVCNPEGLTPGQAVTPTSTATDTSTGASTYSRFDAAPR